MLGQFVSQGLGSPAAIAEWLLVGLSPTGPVDLLRGEPTHTISVAAQVRSITVPAQVRTITVPAPTRRTEV